jgi:hypothetical protein
MITSIERFFPDASPISTNLFSVDLEGHRAGSVVWSEPDAISSELPSKQTLERLVCAAIAAAYPERAVAVKGWLARKAVSGQPEHKAHAWTHMAGWFAKNGCDDFYRAVWRDDKIRPELETRLRASGAWAIAEALAA